MKDFRWNPEKNETLRQERGVSFEEIVLAIDQGNLLDIVKHRNSKKYPHQKMLLVRLRDYVYLIPYVEERSYIFLKTIIPSRKAVEFYFGKESDNEKD